MDGNVSFVQLQKKRQQTLQVSYDEGGE